MTISTLTNLDPRDYDGTPMGIGYARGNQSAGGHSVGSGIAGAVFATIAKLNTVITAINSLAFSSMALPAATKKTVASGVLTVDQSYHTVEGEGAASDTIDTISGGVAGSLLFIRPFDDTHDITLTHSTTIINPGARDIVMKEDDDYALLLQKSTGVWVTIAFKTAATSGGGLGSALASVAASLGASLVGIEDSAGLITATTVEGAFAEFALRSRSNVIADPGTGVAIPVTKSGECKFTIGAGAETNTLAIPAFVGQRIILCVASIGAGTRAVTAAQAINAAGNTIMTFNASTDLCILEAVTIAGALRWRIIFNESVALS
jgi:hypothetical protein